MVEHMLEDGEFQQQFAQAEAAAIQANLTEPRAISAHYDPTLRLIIIHLRSGAVFSFPPDVAQGLADASAKDLAQVEVTPMGDGLHWPALDTDFSIAGLLSGRFGNQKWMANLQQRWSQQQAS
jgi:hypothetical protein